ncbi:SRPBCC family protein [Fulvivirga sp.]|uniref:SRPBCC family protein n=1 Tax=Fulvivirga sp. TaxID=1931237 RepID=UPI0032ED8EC4
MRTTEKTKITIEAEITAPISKVWEYWLEPEHITKWNFASDDWHCPKAEADIKVGGKFSATMAAKDGSMSFDFEGIYTTLESHKKIAYEIADGRTVEIIFEEKGDKVHMSETFEAETTNSIEMQRGGWQTILDNFKAYVESN